MRCLFLLAIIFLPGCDMGPGSGIRVGQKARDIEGTDVKGVPVKLADYEGKVVLLDFWATWCGPCVGSIPEEKQLANKYKGQPFAILGISEDQTRQDLLGYLEHNPLPWSNILDSEGELKKAWRVDGIPTWVLIDHQGIIKGRWEGASEQNINAIAKAVDEAVNAVGK